jgi:DNA repair and recombination protein RAD52
MAFEKAKKEGTTDALKRALRNFGNVLGNCVYDKDFLAKVTKVKAEPTKWDPGNLHRAPQFEQVKKEAVEAPMVVAESYKTLEVSDDTLSMEFDDDFAGELFDEADFGEAYHEPMDGLVDDMGMNVGGAQHQSNGRSTTNPTAPPRNAPQTNNVPPGAPPNQPQRAPSAAPGPGRLDAPPPGPQTPNRARTTPQIQPPPQPQNPLATNTVPQSRPQSIPQSALPSNRANPPSRPPQQSLPQKSFNASNSNSSNNKSQGNSSSPGIQSQNFNAGNHQNLPNPSSTTNPPPTDSNPSDTSLPPATFFSARAAQDPSRASLQKFNPHADSPSIRKTAGIDHASSGPVARKTLGMPPQQVHPAQAGTNTATNFVEPSRDMNRRVGAPPGFSMAGGGGGMSTNSYRSPVVKRMVDGQAVTGSGQGVGSGNGPAIGAGQCQPANQNGNQYQNPNMNFNIGKRRPPLNDVTNTGPASPSPAQGPDVKRIKTEFGGGGNTNGSFVPRNGMGPPQQPTAQ